MPVKHHLRHVILTSAAAGLAALSALAPVSPAAAEGSTPFATLIWVDNLTSKDFYVIDKSANGPGEARAGERSWYGRWNWIDLAEKEWTDYMIGDTGWTLRVRMTWTGVDCRFRPNGYPSDFRMESRAIQDAAPFFCVNQAGTAAYLGRGTPQLLAGLYVFPR